MKKKIFISLFVIISLIALTALYSRYIGTKGLVTKEYKLVYNSIPLEYNGLKIVHFSDLHYYSTIKENELESIVNEINLLKPDIVVFTGDLLEEEVSLDNLVEILNKINCNLKYAVSGNNDQNDKFENLMEKANFKVLNDEYDLVYIDSYTPILLLGLSSSIDNNVNIEDRFNKINDSLNIDTALNILLLHEPDYIDRINYSKFNLILAGHSHNGQVKLPIIGKIHTPVGAKKYYDEYYKVGDTDLYISSGLGTSLYKFRLFNRPSINFYRITNN